MMDKPVAEVETALDEASEGKPDVHWQDKEIIAQPG